MKLVLAPDTTIELRRHDARVVLEPREARQLAEHVPGAETRSGSFVGRLLEAGMLVRDEVPSADTRGSALRPDVRLQLTLADGDVACGIDLASAIDLDPGLGSAAERLQAAFSDIVAGAARQSATRGRVFPRELVRSRLEAAARSIVRELGLDAELGLRVVEDGSISFAPVGTRRFSRAVIDVRRGVARRQVSVPLAHLGEVARLLANLCRPPEARDGESSADLVSTRAIVGALDEVGGLSPVAELPALRPSQCEQDDALAITHLAHAGLIIDGGGLRILVDPWFGKASAKNEGVPLRIAELGAIDAVLFTHHHDDHMLSDALLTLPRGCKAIVPADQGQPLRPHYRRLLGALGFTNVITMQAGDSLSLGGGVTVDTLAFRGESRNVLDFGANLYVVSRSGRGVLIHADSCPDSDGRSVLDDDALSGIVTRLGQIDVVYGSWWQEHRFLFEIHPLAIFAAGVTSERWLEDCECCDVTIDYASALVERLGAKLFLLYAELGDELLLPAGAESTYLASMAATWRTAEEFRAEIEARTHARVVRSAPRLTVHLRRDGRLILDQSEVASSRRSEAG